MMKKGIIIIWLILPAMVFAQEERKHIREGYRAYQDEDYNQAEIEFRKAEDANAASFEAKYNTSAALYEQDKLEESGKKFSGLLAETSDANTEAKLYHNMGNVLLKGEKYQEAAEAFKQSLRLNPDDEDTRYNLAYALEKLRDQQQQQQQNKDQNQNKDQEEQDQQDQQQNQDQQDQQQNQEQQQEQQDQQQQQQQQSGEEEDQQEQQPQPQQQALSQEEAARLLQAILQKEKEVKEKVDKERSQRTKIKTDKDW